MIIPAPFGSVNFLVCLKTEQTSNNDDEHLSRLDHLGIFKT